jgi:flagellar basal-body rod protein FlgG
MDAGLRTAASGMAAQQLRVDTIANNLANVNTTGFKRSRVSFEDAMYQIIQGTQLVNYDGAETIAPVQIGRGVRLAGILRIDSQGDLENTGRPLDIAVQGDGFFQVQRPDGSLAYTRDGTFSISDTGSIVTQNGYTLQPPLTVPPETTAITISANGVVSATSGTNNRQVQLGTLELARFVNPPGLLNLGQNLYAETPASGQPLTGAPQENGFGRVVQGSLESSNVEVVQEMVDMIAAQRAYEVNSKAISATVQMIQTATNELAR